MDNLLKELIESNNLQKLFPALNFDCLKIKYGRSSMTEAAFIMGNIISVNPRLIINRRESIAHELAHWIVLNTWRSSTHGKRWKYLMNQLGYPKASPRASAQRVIPQ